MPFTIKPSENGKYIVLKVTGDMTREGANRQAIAAHALGADLGIRCYMTDVTESRNVESALTNYMQSHSDVRETGIDRGACVAVLAAPDDRTHDFYVTLARTAGMNLTLFHDRDEAIAHLEAAADQLPPLPERES